MKMKMKRTKARLSRFSLVIPDPKAGDRPFEQRPYGRLRMNEAMTKELHRILVEELAELKAKYAAERSIDVRSQNTRISLNLTRKLLDNVEGVIEEKGW